MIILLTALHFLFFPFFPFSSLRRVGQLAIPRGHKSAYGGTVGIYTMAKPANGRIYAMRIHAAHYEGKI